jgi:hypothetical protein
LGVDVLQADDVLLIELAEGDLQYPCRLITGRKEPMYRLTRDEQFLPSLRLENLLAELNAGARVQDYL